MGSSLPAGLLRSLHAGQWIKNTLVFAAPIAAGVINQRLAAIHSLIAFVAFCAATSGTYLLNDIRYLESDRLHPTKRNRPIALGVVPIPAAAAIAIALLAISIGLCLLVNNGLVLAMTAYLALTFVYIYKLKTVPVYDIVAVSASFVLRAVAGAAATEVPISQWFFIVTSFGALFMVVGKREGELRLLEGDAATVRATLGSYTPSYLRFLRAVASGVVLVGYCLWAFESANKVGPHESAQVWFQLSVVPFSVAILRYALLLEAGKGDEPERLVLSDPPLLFAGACWAIIYGYGTYLA